MNYHEILNRIVEIIKNSNSNEGKKLSVCSFKILEEYYDEFSELIKTEKVWFELSNNVNEYIKNNVNLIDSTKSIIKTESQDMVNKLIEILNSTDGLTPKDLEIIDKYVIPKNKKKEFIQITKKLHIGPYIPIRKLGKDESISIYEFENHKLNEQHERIKKYISNSIIEKKDESEFFGNNKILIMLFNSGFLKKDAIPYIGTITDFIKYKSLLLDLKKYLIISDEEYDYYYSLRSKDPVITNTLSDLVIFFSNTKDISLASILNFGDYLPSGLLDDLIFELFKNGTLEASEFDEYINLKYLNSNETSIQK